MLAGELIHRICRVLWDWLIHFPTPYYVHVFVTMMTCVIGAVLLGPGLVQTSPQGRQTTQWTDPAHLFDLEPLARALV